MLLGVDSGDALRCRRAPGQEDDAHRPALRHGVDDLLREALPAVARVAVGLVRAHREAGVEQENAAVGPGREQAASAWRRLERGEVGLEAGVDVLEGRWSGCGRPDGKGETVCLIDVVVRVLSEYDYLDVWKRCVARPASKGAKRGKFS